MLRCGWAQEEGGGVVEDSDAGLIGEQCAVRCHTTALSPPLLAIVRPIKDQSAPACQSLPAEPQCHIG